MQLRWRGHELPELTMLIADDETRARPCFRRSGPLALSYMQLLERPYPSVPALAAIFDAVAERLGGHEQRWRSLERQQSR